MDKNWHKNKIYDSVITTHTAICDGCDNRVVKHFEPAVENRWDACQKLYEEGWRSKDGMVFCNKCAEKHGL